MTGNSLPQLNANVQSLAAPGSPFDLERREHTTRGLHGGPRGVRSLQDRLTHLDLFSGIGGFALAAKWAGFRTIGFSEIEPYASRVLAKNFPDVPNYGDIRNITGIRADILTGGFPCQPFSLAGEQLGAADDRHLWPEMRRVIDDARPTWVVAENVPGIIGMELDNVLSDLEASGYAAWPLVLPACSVNARHRRDRVWIVAHRESVGRGEGRAGRSDSGSAREQQQAFQALADAAREREREQADQANALTACWDTWQESGGGSWWNAEPGVGRVANGIPAGVDRMRGLGNAIVPQVVFPLLDAIGAIEFAAAVAGLRGGSAWEQTGGKAELSRAQMENHD